MRCFASLIYFKAIVVRVSAVQRDAVEFELRNCGAFALPSSVVHFSAILLHPPPLLPLLASCTYMFARSTSFLLGSSSCGVSFAVVAAESNGGAVGMLITLQKGAPKLKDGKVATVH